MGYGSYSLDAHVAITASRQQGTPVRFGTCANPLLDGRGARRECRDSDEHPDTVGIVFALDVSGSMGTIPHTLATSTLPQFMASLEAARIRDPQVCFMAIGHATDRVPFQVGQFESTAALIDAWLTRLVLEGGGVGRHECYELAMWFAANRMDLDSVALRGRRGFMFLTVDTLPNPALSRLEAARILGAELDTDLPIRTVIDGLLQRFEPFVLVAPGASHVERAWRDLFGDRVLLLQDVGDVAHVAAGAIALLEGSVPALPAYLRRLGSQGMERGRTTRIAGSLVAFAASIHRDGAPVPGVDRRPSLPTVRPSGMAR